MTEIVQVPFEPGQTVVVGIGEPGAEQWRRTMVTRVDRRLVWVDAAPEGQPPLDAEPGEQVVCHVWRNMDALYQVWGRVAMSRIADRPLVGLEILKSQRIQQREYVRVPLSTEAWGFHDGLIAPGETPLPVRLQVCDLSASGLRGRAELNLAPGDELAIDLQLPGAAGGASVVPLPLRGRIVALPDLSNALNLRARVVRRVDSPLAGDLSSEIGMTFLDVTKDARERIIRFALDVQREHRRRGIL